MTNVLTVRECVKRAKSDGLPISEYTLRHWVKAGEIPVRHVGAKVLIFYPNLVKYLRCEDGAGNTQPAMVSNGIRRLEV